MKKPMPQADWPASWRDCYELDRLEIWGDTSEIGYVYAFDTRRRLTLELVRGIAAPGARVLDIAGSAGNFTLPLAEAGYDVTWNDFRADLEGYVRLKHDHGTVHYAPGNAFELELPPFDVVLMLEVIEHVAHPDRFLQQVASLVEPGGYLIMTTPNGNFFRNHLPKFSECPDPEQFERMQFGPNAEDHIFLLHDDELPALAEAAGLRIVSLRRYLNPLTCGFLKTAPLLEVLPAALVRQLERLGYRLPEPLHRRLHVGLAVCLQRP